MDRRIKLPLHQAGSEDIPEMLTAKELEALLKIDQKTITAMFSAGSSPTFASSPMSVFRRSRLQSGLSSRTTICTKTAAMMQEVVNVRTVRPGWVRASAAVICSVTVAARV